MAAGGTLRLRQAARIAEVDPAAWDRQFGTDYPFTRHAYLAALESSGCVGADSGWTPAHLLADTAQDGLVGAVPLYLKQHSYGEFVFDFSWAQASQQLGRPYYPKLLAAIPFVPSSGPRIGTADDSVRGRLAQTLIELTQAQRASSCHVLFADVADAAVLRAAGFLERQDVQFHWHRRDAQDFSAFLAQLSSEKRKKIQRERRRVSEAGIRFRVSDGSELRECEWQQIYALYAGTYHDRGQWPYLNLEFLVALAALPGRPLRLILAYQGQVLVAMALTLIGGDTLYGRHWGANASYHSLHFECCYYQGIELCLREGLARYDAGTQGEHKLSRGFTPVGTRSYHYLSEPRLREAVDHYLRRERRAMAAREAELMHHTPYRTAVSDSCDPQA